MSTVAMLVVLKLDGDLEQQGFRVTLEIGPEGDRPLVESLASLPCEPELVRLLDHWQQAYRSLGTANRIMPLEITYGGSVNWREDCQRFSSQLRDRFNSWLDAPSFRPIDRRLREYLSPHDAIRLLIRTQDFNLWRLPWHLWNWMEHYPQAEIALGSLNIERINPKKAILSTERVKILTILGHRTGINVEHDRQILEQLPNAEVTFLIEPQRQNITQQFWEQSWDILFFAGHSQTEGTQGRIFLNSQESLTLEELKYGLRRAIAQGLQLAIFNSCDGLGLAQELASLHLPQLIVMREPVPDPVAQAFLKYFLNAFVQGESLYKATRQAREQLQGLEGVFPCASWLPVICQNSTDQPLDWKGLLAHHTHQIANPSPATPVRLHTWTSFRFILLMSWLITSLIMGLRFLGWLQPLELLAFDHLMRQRPAEQADDRLLLITVDEPDLQYQNEQSMQRQGSLSDAALNQLLKKLEPHQPAAIGLDIYRDRSVSLHQSELQSRLQQVIAICTVGNGEKAPAIKPPPELPVEQIGFANLPLDPDQVVRRYTIGMAPDSICNTSQSFGYQLVKRYLTQHQIPSRMIGQTLQIGNVKFPKLEPHAGGYHQPILGGYEILLNYRNSQPIAHQTSLTEILTGAMDAQLEELVRDRIVLIGTIAPSFRDYHQTFSGERTGVEIHAHLISHLLNTVLNGRPVLWYLPQWGDAVWILGWGTVGGILVLGITSRVGLGCAGAIAMGCLYGLCLLILLQGGWLPLVPSALALIGTGCCAIVRKSTI